MTQAIDPRINDPFTGAQLRLIKQRLGQQRGRYEEIPSRSSIAGSETVQQSLTQRQQLRDKIRHEHNLRAMMRSPAFSDKLPPFRQRPSSRNSLPDIRDRRKATPLHRPLSRTSLGETPLPHDTSLKWFPRQQPNVWKRDPYHDKELISPQHSEHQFDALPPRPPVRNDFVAAKSMPYRPPPVYPRTPQGPTYETHMPAPMVGPHPQGDTHYPKQVVEHQIRPVRLEPLETQQSRLAMPAPAIVPMPQPYIINTADTGRQPLPVPAPLNNTKSDMMEMMMLQNAQMHQMMMNQMMISTLPKPHQQQPAPRSVTLDNNKIAVDIDEIISLKTENKQRSTDKHHARPPSVHHHHYDNHNHPSPRQPPPPAHLPPLQPTYQLQPSQPAYPYGYSYQSPRYYPQEVAPLKPPVAKKKPKPKTPDPPKKIYGNLPFPGPPPLRRFRHAAYAAFFAKSLQKLIKNKKPRPKKEKINEEFMFPIKIKEIIAALHHIYLEPTNRIGDTLKRVSSDTARDLSVVLQPQDRAGKDTQTSRAYAQALEEVNTIVENISYEITEIMPPHGVLGTNKRSHVFDLIQPGRRFPQGYLWGIEKDLVTLDHYGCTVVVSDKEAVYLLAGCFIGRALVTTLLLKPQEHGLTKTRPSFSAQKNLKLLASLFIYLLRKVYTRKSAPFMVPVPDEFAYQLHDDSVIEPLILKIKSSFNYAENLLYDWGKEYVKRLEHIKRTES